ncbi:MAG: NAD(P)-dependent oxidoreductase [Alphaproteobacteria bacterium]|nr:NAD(P)-dependent oxidoreductase [Alphaproteobacteria bacterium]
MNTKVCLITGATGFIGQNIVAELISQKYKIIAISKPDEQYCPTIINENNIKINTMPNINKDIVKDYDMQLVFGDVSDKRFIEKLFKDIEKQNIEIEFVLHLAACATIQQAIQKEQEAWKTNFNGTENILKSSLQYQKKFPNKFKGFFYASTDKVYGEGSHQTYQETDKLKPLPYPYDQSKAKADELVRKIAKENNFPAVIYRFCNVYGPGDYHKSRIIPGTLYRLIYTKENPILRMYYNPQGNKKSFYRDMIYIKDLTKAISLLLEFLRKDNTKLIGEVFNLGTDNTYPMNEIINKISCYSKINREIKEELVEKGEIKNQCMNFSKLNKLLGFNPQYSLDKGIKETVDWYISHKGDINDSFK